MLINFRVSNFLSFNEEVEFSMVKGRSTQLKSHVVSVGTASSLPKLLKFGVLYGANASGKSNWVKAVDFAKSIIVDGLKNKYYLPSHFRLEKTAKERPSRFEFEIVTKDGGCYAYGFELRLDKKTVQEEWLFELKKTTDKPIFERMVKENGQSEMISIPNLSSEDQERFLVYSKDVAPDELLLTVLGTKTWETSSAFFQQTFQWFAKQLLVIFPGSKFHVFSLEEDTVLNVFKEQLQRFNTGIVDLEFQTENATDLLKKMPEEIRNRIFKDLDKGKTPTLLFEGMRLYFSKDNEGNLEVKLLLTKHQGKNGESTSFVFENESDGTQRLFDLIPLIQLISRESLTIVIDEIDRSLHPEMSRSLIETVAEVSKEIANQFIVTTHESSLLDLKLLRRDEIWFVEKNQHGESRIYSLEEFKPRFDKELRKAYLQGRFGAIPFISSPKTLGWHNQKNNKQYAEG